MIRYLHVYSCSVEWGILFYLYPSFRNTFYVTKFQLSVNHCQLKCYTKLLMNILNHIMPFSPCRHLLFVCWKSKGITTELSFTDFWLVGGKLLLAVDSRIDASSLEKMIYYIPQSVRYIVIILSVHLSETAE